MCGIKSLDHQTDELETMDMARRSTCVTALLPSVRRSVLMAEGHELGGFKTLCWHGTEGGHSNNRLENHDDGDD